ncbi:peptidylprolyl isomerase [Notoacmeibacter sp. MSK16QG-6]|uniref:peptidylprolyl isomerase n=1 Tax=Notoacmeibacter sp. MSK16QG-6 TaxID=2957982 RepID=UPI0020A0FD27|nr:peptidylprolyl isomerase [Notoacmeibacter sp. MSK16QG-6]MCP1200724.1 peptidylprolyl isomerase [Notoacmeibacter sp. MSK16QG-6]
MKNTATGLMAGLSLFLLASTAYGVEPDDTLVLTLPAGEVSIALRSDIAPKHVERIRQLVCGGEYDNVAFHRVIDGFMAQTGDVQFGDMEDGYVAGRAGTGGSNLPDLPAEFSDAPFERGTVGMARAASPDSANSQFFIMFQEGSFLNGDYTVVGEVESGMDAVDALAKGDGPNGSVSSPDRIEKATLAAGC